jgi:ferrous iron transport protein B
MWDKASQYFKKIGGTILVAVVIIWALEYFPRSTENQSQENGNLVTNATPDWHVQSQIEHSYLGIIGHAIEPLIRPLGFDWRMGICLVAGIPAKEIVVSTMGVLYETGKDNSKSRELLPEVLKSEVYFSGPRMGEKVFNRAVALSFLVFVLLYFPCIAVIATIKRESGSWRWALFTVFYTTAFAWIMAFVTYNIALYFIRI